VTLTNLHLFELMNAGPELHGARLWVALALAQYSIGLVPLGWLLAWLRADLPARADLLQMAVASVLALMLAELVAHVWPQPRPLALHVGTHFLPTGSDAGLPSDVVTVFWCLALAALFSRRYAPAGFPLLSLGLAAGWSRIYLGANFPLDVLAALPAAALGVAAAWALRPRLLPLFGAALRAYERLEQRARARLGRL
jgi:undecaprenyl-diphosphatase